MTKTLLLRWEGKKAWNMETMKPTNSGCFTWLNYNLTITIWQTYITANVLEVTFFGRKKFQLTSGGGPYGFSFASSLIISSGFLPRRVDKTCINNSIESYQHHTDTISKQVMNILKAHWAQWKREIDITNILCQGRWLPLPPKQTKVIET